MSNDGVNAGRRRFLVAATSVVGAAGAVGAAVPFVGSWFPSAKAKAAGAPVQVNVGKIDPGQQIIAEWRGKPVFIVHRTKEMLDALPSLEGQLADPDSKASEQPEYVDPKLRSIKPELAVIVGICTHLGPRRPRSGLEGRLLLPLPRLPLRPRRSCLQRPASAAEPADSALYVRC
ncbi:Ubiquinol-cytochrome c reductase iron-sulfur subunit [Pseudomonas aeruginosa]|nr:Ubiquinol-cytochrome c reductase iron-sulfur subunit [Pseudomonas aeruginosa]